MIQSLCMYVSFHQNVITARCVKETQANALHTALHTFWCTREQKAYLNSKDSKACSL